MGLQKYTIIVICKPKSLLNFNTYFQQITLNTLLQRRRLRKVGFQVDFLLYLVFCFQFYFDRNKLRY
jgi:hypothetical protein